MLTPRPTHLAHEVASSRASDSPRPSVGSSRIRTSPSHQASANLRRSPTAIPSTRLAYTRFGSMMSRDSETTSSGWSKYRLAGPMIVAAKSTSE